MSTIRPLRDQVLVKQDPPKEKLGSLFVPQGTRELYEDVGTVIAVGSGVVGEGGEIIPVSVKPGDRVMFKRRPASVLNPDAREGDEWFNLLMLKDEDMVAVLEENTTCVQPERTRVILPGDGTPETITDAKEIKTDTSPSARECECH